MRILSWDMSLETRTIPSEAEQPGYGCIMCDLDRKLSGDMHQLLVQSWNLSNVCNREKRITSQTKCGWIGRTSLLFCIRDWWSSCWCFPFPAGLRVWRCMKDSDRKPGVIGDGSRISGLRSVQEITTMSGGWTSGFTSSPMCIEAEGKQARRDSPILDADA